MRTYFYKESAWQYADNSSGIDVDITNGYSWRSPWSSRNVAERADEGVRYSGVGLEIYVFKGGYTLKE